MSAWKIAAFSIGGALRRGASEVSDVVWWRESRNAPGRCCVCRGFESETSCYDGSVEGGLLVFVRDCRNLSGGRLRGSCLCWCRFDGEPCLANASSSLLCAGRASLIAGLPWLGRMEEDGGTSEGAYVIRLALRVGSAEPRFMFPRIGNRDSQEALIVPETKFAKGRALLTTTRPQ